jgi:hypothetical protein
MELLCINRFIRYHILSQITTNHVQIDRDGYFYEEDEEEKEKKY